MLGCTVRSACRRAASAAAGGFRGSAESTVRQNRQDSAVRRSFPVRFVWWTETETFGVGSLPVWRRAVVASEIFDIFAISYAVSGLAGRWVRSACRRAASAAACARGCAGWAGYYKGYRRFLHASVTVRPPAVAVVGVLSGSVRRIRQISGIAGIGNIAGIGASAKSAIWWNRRNWRNRQSRRNFDGTARSNNNSAVRRNRRFGGIDARAGGRAGWRTDEERTDGRTDGGRTPGRTPGRKKS